jgi:periplasmic protein TonB
MTNKALIYRPVPRWGTTAAFIAALMIHFSAIVAASHRQKAPVPAETGFTPIGVELLIAPQPPAPAESPVPPPPPASHSEFREPPRSHREIAKPRPAVPIRAAGPTRFVAPANPKALALSAPKPLYPYEARSRHVTGSGVAVMTIDPATGIVINVVMEPSIGSEILDRATVSAFKRWRFKPGSPPKVRVPITFLLTGASY